MNIQRDLLIAQVINFAFLFFLVKWLWGDKIIKAIEERKQLIKKLKWADEEYERMIQLAKKESNKIITKANKKKETILSEGKSIAENEKKQILELAMNKSDIMIKNAEEKGEKMLNDLKAERKDAVTDTTQLVVQKLLNNHKPLKEEYLETITQELKKRKKT